MVPRDLISECFGTATLVFIGCGSAAIGGFGTDWPGGALPIALAFGLCLTFLIYALGPISGCHVNPAVTLGLFAANRFPASKVPGYIAAQIVGGLVGASALVVILSGKTAGYDIAVNGLGQNGWGPTYLGGYNMVSAFTTEVLATFIFMIAILGATQNSDSKGFAGVSIGFALFALIICFINVNGVSLNPARSIGPAMFVGGTALLQVWLFVVAPVMGAIVAGLACRRIDP